MKATLLVLLLSAVAVMLSCDHQHSEREAGPGCPLGKRLAFDVNTTIEESKRLNNEYFDCPNPEPGAPCFYYSHVFYPFFVIEDTVVGESDRFHDSYTFKVVGGGRTRESVRNYSQEEILKFNSLRDSESYQQTLVWTFDDVPDSFPLTKEGFIVMRGASNRVRWLCQRNSPCGDLTPVNHLDPDFYFVVEVSNMETAGSPFCEYTVRFELHVHGFPLDPVRALFFHQMTMTVVQTILICYIGHTCWRLKRKTVYTKTRDGLDEQEGHEQFNAGRNWASLLPRDPNPEEADDDGWMDGWMLKLCSEVEFFRSTLNGATPGTRSLRPGEPGKLRKMCPERDASALSGFIPPWERQRFNTHSFRQPGTASSALEPL
ncbi:hypothetical protein SRHO_G00342010 [Serrasalmus rhombeus]